MLQDALQETAASPEVAELRDQLLDATQERDVDRLRDLLPRAELGGVPSHDLENAQCVLNFRVQNILLTQLEV